MSTFSDQAKALAQEVEMSLAHLAEMVVGQWFTEAFTNFSKAQSALNNHLITTVDNHAASLEDVKAAPVEAAPVAPHPDQTVLAVDEMHHEG
jgi:hypothetical protein